MDIISITEDIEQPKKQIELIAQRYLTRKKIGEGTFGVVYFAEDKELNQFVALKRVKVRSRQDGIDYNTIQEIRQLQELSHPNIVKFIGAYHHKTDLFLVTEYLGCGLDQLIHQESGKFLSDADIKSIMKQMLTGLSYLHENWVLHRDIKPQNIMFSMDGTLKLIDFGLSCDYPSDFGNLISQVVTIWYKSPELLYDSNYYGPSIDIWSVACVMAEMYLKKPSLPGRNDFEELQIITNYFGPLRWPGCDKLNQFKKIEPNFPQIPIFSDLFPSITPDAIDLLYKMFTIDPSKRITAQEALKHPYFHSYPEPTPPSKLPLPPPKKGYSNGMTTTGMFTGFSALTSRVVKAPGTTLLK